MRSDVLLRSFTEITQEPGSVIDIVTRLRARRPRDRSLISGGGKRFISCPLGPDRVQGTSSIQLPAKWNNGDERSFLRAKTARVSLTTHHRVALRLRVSGCILPLPTMSWRAKRQLLYSSLDDNACAPLEWLHANRNVWYSGQGEYYRHVKISNLFAIARISIGSSIHQTAYLWQNQRFSRMLNRAYSFSVFSTHSKAGTSITWNSIAVYATIFI